MATSENKNFEKAADLFKEISNLFEESGIKKTVPGLKLYKKFLELELEFFNLTKSFEAYQKFNFKVEERKNLKIKRLSRLIAFLKQKGPCSLTEILNDFDSSERTIRRDLGFLVDSGKIKTDFSGKKKKYACLS